MTNDFENLFASFGDVFEDFLGSTKVPPRQNFSDGGLIEIELNGNTRSARKKRAWTHTNLARAVDVKRIIMDREQHWPMTERAVFYRVFQTCLHQAHWHKNGKVENGLIKPNTLPGTIGALLKWLRIGEVIPWEAIIDEQRVLTGKVGFSDTEEFIRQVLGDFLHGYRRCLATKQKYNIEVWMEKATLLHIVRPITDRYCRRLMCCKVYNSVTFQNGFYNRAMETISRDQIPVVLYFGDWDPSGVNMLYASAQTLIDEMGLWGTHFYRCGINPEHFNSIQADPVPVKPSDSRSKKFIEKYAATAYELDAFEPEELQRIVEESILKFTDMEAIQNDLDQEPEDQEKLKCIRMKVRDLIREEL